jgi:hypothetical protein
MVLVAGIPVTGIPTMPAGAALASTAIATATASAINMAEFFGLQIAHLLHSQNKQCTGRT